MTYCKKPFHNGDLKQRVLSGILTLFPFKAPYRPTLRTEHTVSGAKIIIFPDIPNSFLHGKILEAEHFRRNLTYSATDSQNPTLHFYKIHILQSDRSSIRHNGVGDSETVSLTGSSGAVSTKSVTAEIVGISPAVGSIAPLPCHLIETVVRQ